MKKKILLVDDHPIILNGIKSMIESLDDFEVMGAISNPLHVFDYLKTFDIDILILQILPRNWRIAPKIAILKAILKPFKELLNDIDTFRTDAISRVNLSAQTIVIEHHLKKITGEKYGVYVSDELPALNFSVNVPNNANGFQAEIESFLKQVTPIGRVYTLNFY